MSRDIGTSNSAALDAAHVRPVTFVSLAFDSGTLYLHDNIGLCTWGGHDWQGVGDFGSVDLIEEGEQAAPFAVRLRLSGLDATIVNEALGEDYFLRSVLIYIGFFNSANALIETPSTIWSGQMDTMDVQVGAENVVLLTCESYLARLDRINGKLFTDAEQRIAYSADTFFSYLPKMQEVTFIWGETREPGRRGKNSLWGKHGLAYFHRPDTLF